MASGTIKLGSNKANLEGRINWSSSSNGSNANTSNVWAEIQIRRNDGYTTTGIWNGSLNIGGQKQSFSVHTSVSSSWITMKSFTKYNVPHNDDGSGSCGISGYCNGPSGTSMAGATVNGSQTVTLDKIARYLSITGFSIQTKQVNKVIVKWSVSHARYETQYSLNGGSWIGSATYGESVASDNKSGTFNIINLEPNTKYTLKIRCQRKDSGLYTESNQISFTTFDIARFISVPNVNIGSSQTLKWNNPSGAQLKLRLRETSGVTITDYGVVTGTSKTITPDSNSLYKLIPNSNSGTASYSLITIQNNKEYYEYGSFNFFVTNSNPTFNNFTYLDSNSKTVNLTGNNQYLIKNHSSVKVTISTANKAIARNSATMKKYRLSVGTKTKDANYSSNADVNIELANIDNNTLIVYAIDSRNNSTSKSITATKYISYENINIRNITLNRSDGGVGQRVTLKYDGYIWNNNFGTKNNSIKSIKYQYKQTTSNTWIDGKTVLTPNLSGNSYSQTIEIQGDLAGEGFNRQNSYDFRIIISDELSSYTKAIIMTSGIPLYAFSRNGIAILSPYNEDIDAALQVNGKIVANSTEDVFSAKQLYNNASGSTGTITLSESAANFKVLEIFSNREGSAYYESNRIFEPNNKDVQLTTSYSDSITASLYSKRIRISGTSITVSFSYGISLRSSNEIEINTYNDNRIYKVIGYR